jgi:hypothetical protein
MKKVKFDTENDQYYVNIKYIDIDELTSNDDNIELHPTDIATGLEVLWFVKNKKGRDIDAFDRYENTPLFKKSIIESIKKKIRREEKGCIYIAILKNVKRSVYYNHNERGYAAHYDLMYLIEYEPDIIENDYF